ncbi:MAG: hypothetical protein HYX71_02820 [Opitutae bacterium]|nr:hypothetical protein [Opitutae bacterium]
MKDAKYDLEARLLEFAVRFVRVSGCGSELGRDGQFSRASSLPQAPLKRPVLGAALCRDIDDFSRRKAAPAVGRQAASLRPAENNRPKRKT